MEKRKNKTFIAVIAVFLVITVLGLVSGLFSQGAGGSGGDNKSTGTTTSAIIDPVPIAKTWKTYGLTTNYSFTARFAYDDNGKIIVGGSHGKIFISYDGKNFTEAPICLPLNETIVDLCRVGDRYLVVSETTGIYSCSVNFSEWVHVLEATGLQAIAHCDEYVFSVGKKVAFISSDLIQFSDWSSVPFSAISYDVCFAFDQFLFVGTDSNLYSIHMSSPYEANFLISPVVPGGSAVKHISFQEDGYLYIIGSKGDLLIKRTNDLEEWTETTIPSGDDTNFYPCNLVFCGDSYYLLGYAGANSNDRSDNVIYSSIDGCTWTALENPKGYPPRSILFANGKLYLFGVDVFCVYE